MPAQRLTRGVVSERVQYFLVPMEPYGFFIIIGFLYLGIFDPLVAFSQGIIAVLIGILLP